MVALATPMGRTPLAKETPGEERAIASGKESHFCGAAY